MLMANVTTQNYSNLKWSHIDWSAQNKMVNHLRQRIYRASEMGDLKRVRSLQRLMLKSTANKLTAIHRITQQNIGRNTLGIDNVIVQSHKARKTLYQALKTAKPGESFPVKRIYIPKKKGRRALGLPTIFDRCMQAIVKNALEPYWEAKFEPTSYGFRPRRSAHDALERIFSIANSKNTRKWVLDADIRGAFDNIDHKFLLKALKGFVGISWIKQWLVAGYVEDHKWYPTEAGTPQGGVISPLLANIAVHGMEDLLGVKYNSQGRLLKGCSMVVRYADDFVVFHETREGCEEAKQKIEHWLAHRGLELSESKTHIRHLTEGFDFLGFHIRHYAVRNRRLPYYISDEAIKKCDQALPSACKDYL
jgi:RNA-directed DNA polymerase